MKYGMDVNVSVSGTAQQRRLTYVNDVLPILSRHGCNSSGCHGKAEGQNGFRLSVFGFDPNFDYNALVKEARGRRTLVSAPAQSLVLKKVSGQTAHGGGVRLPPRQAAPRRGRTQEQRAKPTLEPSRTHRVPVTAAESTSSVAEGKAADSRRTAGRSRRSPSVARFASGPASRLS